MNKKILLVVSLTALLFAGCSNYTRKEYIEIPLAEGENVESMTEFCAFEDVPQGVPFTVLGMVKAAKGTYGGTAPLRPTIIERANAKGGNSVANYHENQRFGFWPWRVVRPIASGDAIKILNPRGKSCAEMGGYVL